MTSAGHLLLVCVAGVLAGGVNAIAGGGTLISFPALLALGIPPVAANVTSRVGLVTSYAGGATGYRRELAGQGHRVRVLSVGALVGGVAGAVILLLSPERSFRVVVPYLVLFSCLLLAVQPILTKWLAKRREARSAAPIDHTSPLVHTGVILSSAYASYFGAGVGVLLLAIFAILIEDDIQRLNGLKNVLILVANIVGVVLFAFSGRVDWPIALLLIVTAYGGGLLGSRLARKVRSDVLRAVVIAFGVVVVGALFATS